MKLPKVFIFIGFILTLPLSVFAQTGSLVGSWQLVKQSSCLEEPASRQDDSLEGLRNDMHNRASATAQVVSFKGNSSGEESTRILNKKRPGNPKKFFYKLSGDMLFILDKKSQTISDSYRVDKFTADSLILSNVSRPCEIKIFVKIKEGRPN
jgi:Endonuclease I